MILARLAREVEEPVAAFAIMRLVKMPSPVASFGKIMWPDCSPPILMS